VLWAKNWAGGSAPSAGPSTSGGAAASAAALPFSVPMRAAYSPPGRLVRTMPSALVTVMSGGSEAAAVEGVEGADAALAGGVEGRAALGGGERWEGAREEGVPAWCSGGLGRWAGAA
jgi:hypothetical protein